MSSPPVTGSIVQQQAGHCTLDRDTVQPRSKVSLIARAKRTLHWDAEDMSGVTPSSCRDMHTGSSNPPTRTRDTHFLVILLKLRLCGAVMTSGAVCVGAGADYN